MIEVRVVDNEGSKVKIMAARVLKKAIGPEYINMIKEIKFE